MSEEPWDGKTERRLVSIHCQQEILERLTKIEVEFSLARRLLEDIKRAFHGNGRDGLLVRHDRVEQRVNAFLWVIGVIFVGLVGVAFKAWFG